MLAHPGLYIHFPWCVRKCPYCDFNSHPLKDDTDRHAYVQALLTDLGSQCERWAPGACASIFLGGGTPSLFEPAHLEPLMQALPQEPGAEVTMEANPGTTEHADFAGYTQLGVNRLSLGAQSFDDRKLAQLGRIHSASETLVAFDQARAAGIENINIDLMWGLPGQTVAEALADLDQAIAVGPEHISWYQLTIEARTEFARRPPILPSENTLERIETAGVERLAQAGFTRYEVSAYARRGAQCRHNLNYWQFGDYLGIGAGAHGKVTTPHGPAMRTARPRQPRLFQQNPLSGTESVIGGGDLPAEFMLNALRLTDGVEFEVFERTTQLSWDSVADIWQQLIEQGLARSDRCGLTPQGQRFLDTVVQRFLLEGN